MRERDQRIAHRLLLADAGDPLAGFFAGEAQLLVAAREELLDVALAARAAPACSLPSSIILDGWLLVGLGRLWNGWLGIGRNLRSRNRGLELIRRHASC